MFYVLQVHGHSVILDFVLMCIVLKLKAITKSPHG